MTVQGRDVIFKFENSCNSDCFKWFSCCKKEIQDEDAVFVTPRGQVRKFDYKAKPGANENAKRTLSNIQKILEQVADDHNKNQAILVAIQNQMNLSFEPVVPHIISASQVKRIEAIALPILRAPSPEPLQIPKTPTNSKEWPASPKRSQSGLVRSPEMRDLRIEEYVDVAHSDALQED